MSTRPTRRAATMHISYKVDEEDSSEFNEEVSSAEVHDEEESSSGSSAQDFAYSNNADKDGVKENQDGAFEIALVRQDNKSPKKITEKGASKKRKRAAGDEDEAEPTKKAKGDCEPKQSQSQSKSAEPPSHSQLKQEGAKGDGDAMETGEKRDETSGEVRVEDGPSDAAPVTAAPDFEPATPKAKAKPKAKSTPQSKSKKKNSSGDGNDEDEDDFQLEEEADDDDFDEDDDGDEDAHAEGDRDESDGVKKKKNAPAKKASPSKKASPPSKKAAAALKQPLTAPTTLAAKVIPPEKGATPMANVNGLPKKPSTLVGNSAAPLPCFSRKMGLAKGNASPLHHKK